MIKRTQSGVYSTDIKCSNEEFKNITLTAINSCDDIFSFKQLCDHVCRKLEEADFLNKDENVIYQGGYKLTSTVTDKIQYFVWEQIWDRKLMIDLLNDEYRYTPDRNSIRLIKVK